MRITRHFVARAEERTICAAEVREVLRDVHADERKAGALADLLQRGEVCAVRSLGITLVLAPAEDEPKIVTTYRSGRRRW